MTEAIELRSRVGPDGTLDVRVPLGQSEAGAEVLITIRPMVAEATPRDQQDPAEWHEFVERTYGSCAGLELERQPQGEYEEREGIE